MPPAGLSLGSCKSFKTTLLLKLSNPKDSVQHKMQQNRKFIPCKVIVLLKEIPLATGNFIAWTCRDELRKYHVKLWAVIICTVKRPNAFLSVITNVEVWLIVAREFFVDRSVKVMVPSGVTVPLSSTQETLTGSRNLIVAEILPVCATCGKSSMTVIRQEQKGKVHFPAVQA